MHRPALPKAAAVAEPAPQAEKDGEKKVVVLDQFRKKRLLAFPSLKCY